MPTELEEAISAVTATSGSALIQKYIDPLILEYVRRYSPLLAALPDKQLVGTNAYNWVTRSALPDGGATSDGGARSMSSSVWTQSPSVVKNYQAVGGVTGFAQAVTGVINDLQRSEMDGAVKSLGWAVETSLIYANDLATLGIPAQTSGGATVAGGPDMRGLDYQVNTYSGSVQNSIDEAHGAVSFSILDNLIDLIEENAAQPLGGDWMFLTSPKMSSKINQLLTNQQRFVNDGSGGQQVAVAGMYVPAYRDCPIIKSSFLAARTQQMGTVTSATATTTGTLPASSTYIYGVSAVINRFGEVGVSADVSQATGSGTATNTITLSFSTPTGPDSNGPILYKVYRTAAGAGTATKTLLGVVAAFDDTGAAVTSIVDNGTNLLLNGRTQSQMTTAGFPATYQDGNAGQFPRAVISGVGDEDIYLVPKTDEFIVRPYVRDFFTTPLAQVSTAPDVLPFYVASDTCLAVRAPKYVARASRVTATL